MYGIATEVVSRNKDKQKFIETPNFGGKLFCSTPNIVSKISITLWSNQKNMGIFDLFRKRKNEADSIIKPQQHTAQQPTQYQRALQFNSEFAELLGCDSFIARSDYKHFISAYQEEYKFL